MSISGSLFSGLEEKRKRICEAAIDIFKEKNFNQTTVSEIASKAHVGKGTFYLYFDSKLKLLDFLLEYGTDKLIEHVKESVDNEEDGKKKLKQAIDAQLEFHDLFRDFFTFFVREMWVHREGLKAHVNKLKEDYIVIFEEIIEDGINDGDFKNVNNDTVSSALFGMLSISSLHWIIFEDHFPVDEVNDDLKEVFFEGILNN